MDDRIYRYDRETKELISIINFPADIEGYEAYQQYNKLVQSDDCIVSTGSLPLPRPVVPGLPTIVPSNVNLLPILRNNPIPISYENPSTNIGFFRETVKQLVIENIKDEVAISQALSIETKLPDKSYKLYAGYRYLDFSVDPQKSDPIDRDTILRMASTSKVVTAATVLKYVEDNKISLSDPLEKYFPEYSNPEVIKLVTPIASVPIQAITVVPNTTQIVVTIVPLTSAFPLITNVNSLIGAFVSLNSIISPVYAITSPLTAVPNPTDVYTVISAFASTPIPNVTVWNITIDVKKTYPWGNIPAGGVPIIYTLDILSLKPTSEAPCYGAIDAPISFDTIANPVRFYYTTVPASNKIKLCDLITHRSGHVYTDIFIPAGHSTFRNELVVCAAIARLKHPEFRTTYANIDVLEWVKLTSDVPLAFEPGTAWSYGLQLGILGGVLVKYERMKSNNMSLYQIQKKYIFDPLEMNSASYFIQDNDPKRNEKISNLIHSYSLTQLLPGLPIILTTPGNDFNTNIVNAVYGYIGDYSDGANPNAEGDANPWHPIYGTNAPRKLELGDVGLIMNNEDFTKFTYMLRHGGKGKNGIRVLEKETVKNMAKNHIGRLSITLAIGEPPSIPFLPNQKWGLGVRVEDDSTKTDGMSCTSMSWKGSRGSRWFVDFETWTNYNSMTNSGLSGQYAEYISNNIACAYGKGNNCANCTNCTNCTNCRTYYINK